MQCAKFEQRLQQLLDDRQIAERNESLCEHAESCERCASILRAQSRLFSSVSKLPEPALPDDFANRILDRLQVERRRQRRKRMTIAALAAAAMIMISLLPLSGDGVPFLRNGDSNGSLALVDPASQVSPRNALTAQESRDLRLLMHQLMQQLSDGRLEMLSPVDQFASGIRPLTITFNFALDTLRRTLPGYSARQAVEPQAVFGRLQHPIG
jgi:predicted anti-sigma-YlaC factor YlaD